MGKDPAERDRLRGIHVLFVDDNPDSRDLIKAQLEYYGALVHVAWSAETALDRLTRITPDVVITDLSMPGYDGRWLLQHIRRRPRGEMIPVIALTAYDTRYARDVVLGEGFTDYYTKPVSAEALCAAVARLVGR